MITAERLDSVEHAVQLVEPLLTPLMAEDMAVARSKVCAYQAISPVLTLRTGANCLTAPSSCRTCLALRAHSLLPGVYHRYPDTRTARLHAVSAAQAIAAASAAATAFSAAAAAGRPVAAVTCALCASDTHPTLACPKMKGSSLPVVLNELMVPNQPPPPPGAPPPPPAPTAVSLTHPTMPPRMIGGFPPPMGAPPTWMMMLPPGMRGPPLGAPPPQPQPNPPPPTQAVMDQQFQEQFQEMIGQMQ
jgi:hypothetical protein